MKRFVICLLLLSLLAACVPTPEVDAVKQKDTNILIDTVLTENREQDEAAATLPPVKEQFPDRFQCDFYTSAQNVHVTADVPLEILTDGVFPMLRVERRTLSNKERMTVAQRVFGTDALYIFEEHVTRKDLERWIRELMQEPSPEEKAEWMREEGGTEEEWQEMLENRKATAATYQQQYNELPDDDARAPLQKWDGSVPEYVEHSKSAYDIVSVQMPEGYLYKQDSLTVYANEQDRPLSYCVAWQDNDLDVTWADFFDGAHKYGAERIMPENYDTPHEGAAVTPNDAIRSVQELFSGVVNLIPADVYWSNNAATDGDGSGKCTRWGYLIHFSQNYNGAYAPYCSSFTVERKSDGVFAVMWRYETLKAVVDGEGRLISFDWLAPLKVSETVSESTPLLPYSEIQKIFETQMNRMFAYDKANGAALTLESVQLGLFRIREKNDMEHGLLVPVWFFTGVYEFSEQEAAYRRAEGLSETQAAREYLDNLNPLLLINAIDGSIIDTINGY